MLHCIFRSRDHLDTHMTVHSAVLQFSFCCTSAYLEYYNGWCLHNFCIVFSFPLSLQDVPIVGLLKLPHCIFQHTTNTLRLNETWLFSYRTGHWREISVFILVHAFRLLCKSQGIKELHEFMFSVVLRDSSSTKMFQCAYVFAHMYDYVGRHWCNLSGDREF